MIFRVLEDSIEIARVLHAAMDFSRHKESLFTATL